MNILFLFSGQKVGILFEELELDYDAHGNVIFRLFAT
jgi:hypothetical protein